MGTLREERPYVSADVSSEMRRDVARHGGVVNLDNPPNLN